MVMLAEEAQPPARAALLLPIPSWMTAAHLERLAALVAVIPRDVTAERLDFLCHEVQHREFWRCVEAKYRAAATEAAAVAARWRAVGRPCLPPCLSPCLSADRADRTGRP
jgi:hypothetical protein